MLEMKLTFGQSAIGNTLPILYNGHGIVLHGTGIFHSWLTPAGDSYFLLGDIYGKREADGTISDAARIKSDPAFLENSNRIPEAEGRFVLITIRTSGDCEVWADQYGRSDIYWQHTGDLIVVSTGLNHLPVATLGSNSNNIGLAHSLTVYGSRPAKKHTLYENVCRLGINQGLMVAKSKVSLLHRIFRPISTVPSYGTRDLDRYSDYFLEAVRSRASIDGNIVYLSSGWDSTAILAALVHLLGNRKVRAVIGRMKYSDRSGVINQFEINRAKAVAEYFKIHLDIIELDYRAGADSILSEVKSLFRAQQFGNLTGVNHWQLAKGAAKTADGSEVIFAGEMSDGAHNLGFSQFTTIFHPTSQDFREYSDKMASYLFGPTFLRQLQMGNHEQDPVWKILRQRAGAAIFDPVRGNDNSVAQQLLASFFLRGSRLPLYSIANNALLTAQGRELFSKESERLYLDNISELVTPETIYSCYLHLYNSFHWQGATVSTLEHTAESFGLRCALPFNDSELIKFLSAMPEEWGRGLDLKPTKYPLKWMLSNRIDYPLHLQVGPHSYTYDVDPKFSLLGEILYASSFKSLFKKNLQRADFINWMDREMFDHSYIGIIVGKYLRDEELTGQQLNDLGVLAVHETIGFYGSV